VSDWQQRALSEKNPVARIQALIALARNGQPSLQKPVIQALTDLEWNALDEQSRLDLCRALGLAFIRLGSTDQEPDLALRLAVVDYLDKHYPADNYRLNRELCQLLVYLRAPDVAGRTLALLKAAPTQEEQIHYALCLRVLSEGWSPEQRREYFQWFQDAGATRGGASFGGFLRNIRNDAIATLTPPEKEQLSDILDARPTRQEVPTVARTTVVKQWTLDELLPELQKGLKGRSFEKGREYFAQASCYKCHRLAGEGGISGPDLTGVAGRFNQHDLLEAIVEPSKVISDQYQATQFVLADGRTITGRVVNLSGRGMSIMTNMLEPDGQMNVERNDVEEILPSPISMMPTGLLDTFDKEEILDLFAYMQAGGDPEHEVFEK
jgi:putative heme-binding domain-containing protein